MARSINDIQEQILKEKEVSGNLSALEVLTKNEKISLANLTSSSKVSIWRLWVFVIASVIHYHERLWDIFRKEVDDEIAKKQIHTLRWYKEKAFAFQYGRDLVNEKDYYDNTDVNESDVIKQKIIKQCAIVRKVSKNRGFLEVKVAKEDNKKLVPLSIKELEGFKSYMLQVADAGTFIQYTSIPNDWLKLKLEVHYNPLILDNDGKRKDGTSDKPIQDTIDEFLKSLEFDGELVLTELTDVLQGIEGIEMPVIKNAYAKINQGTYSNPINETYIAQSGYMELDKSDIINDIKYIPREIE